MGVVKANKVKVGFFSFTEITDPGEHHAYNEWHQLDHMPEQFPLPGIAFGQRWVSTPACRAARAVDGELLAPIHYVTLYLMTEPIDETLRDFMALGRELHEVDRFHQHRRAHLSGPVPRRRHRAPRRVSSSPPRPSRTGPTAASTSSSPRATSRGRRHWRRRSRSPASPGSGPSGRASDFAARWKTGRRTITVCWLDGEPLAVAPELDAGLSGALAFAGPFETVVPWQWDWFDAPGSAAGGG